MADYNCPRSVPPFDPVYDAHFDSPRVLVPPPMIFAGFLVAGLVIDSKSPPSLPLALAAAALAGTGLVLDRRGARPLS